MTSVGAYLRELRTRRGVSLEEISRRTRVAPRYLEALEADALDGLPAPVFTRGFIRAYCQALAESPDEALACYDGREPGPRPTPVQERGEDAESRPRGAIIVSLVLLAVMGMALFTVALVIRPQEVERETTAPELRPAPAATMPTEGSPATVSPLLLEEPSPPPPVVQPPVAAPPPASAPSSAVRPPAPSPAAVTPPAANPLASASRPAAASMSALGGVSEVVLGRPRAPYRLVARTSETTWIRVRTEDGRTSEEQVPAGEVREWVSDRPFVLTVGNAGGVSLELNGRALPPLGAPGVVISRLVVPPDSR